MDVGIISVRYAKALLKCATDEGMESQVYHEMSTFVGNYMSLPDLKWLLENPTVSKEKKLRVVGLAMGDECSDLTKNFVELVLDKGRIRILQFIASSYISLYRKQKKIINGRLTTAVSVSAEVEKKFKDLVASVTPGNVEFQTIVDPEIIGGFILEYDTYRLDASVKSKLNAILLKLKK